MNEDPILTATNRPSKESLDHLVTEYSRCSPVADGWDRMANSDEVRFCRWPGQNADGKKHDNGDDDPAFPWDGASDSQPMLADTIIGEIADVQQTAFWAAVTRAKASATEANQYAVTLIDYFVNTVMTAQLATEVELSAQYLNHYGWVLLQPTWEVRLAMRNQSVSLDALVQLAQSVARVYPQFQTFMELVTDPMREEEAVAVMRLIWEVYAKAQLPIKDVNLPAVKDSTLRRALNQLRKEGSAEIPVPFIAKNGPVIYARRPWEEIFLAGDTMDLQEARVIFLREWVTEADLKARVNEEGYDEAWVNEAMKHKGAKLATAPNSSLASVTVIRGSLSDAAPSDCVEVVHGFYRAVTDDDVPGIYCTTFHPKVKVGTNNELLYAKHTLVDYPHGKYPFVSGRRERWCRVLTASRGVPEIVRTWQNQEKALEDGIIDWTSIGVIPPVNTYKTPYDTRYKFGPAVQNLVQPGKEPQFMNVPSSGVMPALEALQRLGRKVCRYFGLDHPEVPPEVIRTKKGANVARFLIMWTEAFEHLALMAQKYMPDGEFARATGAPPGWLDQRRQQFGVLAVDLSFDVRELNEELTMKRIEAVNKAVLPADVQGVIQRNKWIQLMLRAINPTWSKELVMPASEASDKLFNDVKSDIAQMFLGNPPKMVQNDPTAQAKLQFASQIVASNPFYQEALKQQGRFQELMQIYVENLSFSVTQDRNKQIGRIGVDPSKVQGGAGGN